MLTPRGGFVRLVASFAMLSVASLVAQVDPEAKAEPLAKRLDAALRKVHESTGVPGISAAAVVGDQIVWAAGIGERALGREQAGNAVTAQTRFQAASISKPITAMAVMRLKVAAKLDLDKPIAQLPGRVTLERQGQAGETGQAGEAGQVGETGLTLRHLLSHTGGTNVHGFPGYAPGLELPSIDEVLAGKGNTDQVRIDLPVGKQFRYSGGGYCAVQKILTASREQPFAQLMHELVLEPLGMKHSVYAQPLPKELWPQAACAHRDGEILAERWFVYPELAAAGLWTTASDLLRPLLAMRASEVGEESAFFPKDVATEMLTVQPNAERFGIGWMVRRQGERWMYGHSGGNQGFLCDAVLTSMGKRVVGVAVMINCENGRALGEIRSALMGQLRAK